MARENGELRAELEQWRASGVASPAAARRFRLLAESIPQLVWTSGADGRCDYLGPQWVAYTGEPAEAQLGFGWLQKVHPEDRERVNREWTLCAAAGTAVDIDFRILRADGNYRWFKTRALPVRDAGGEIVQWLGTNTDVEELRQAEAEVRRLTEGLEREVAARTYELKRVSERLLAATSGANVGIWDWDIRNDQLSWDERMYALHGLESKDAAGALDVWRHAIHPDDMPTMQTSIERARAGEAPLDVKFRVRGSDGKQRHLHAVGALHRDAAGNPERLLGVNWDITCEVVAQEQLRVSEERWNFALQGTGDGVWDWDIPSGRVYLSHRSRELLGLDGDEVTTTEQRSPLVHPEDAERLRSTMEAHLRGETPAFACEYRLRRTDGRFVWVLGQGRVIARDPSGKPLRLVGTHKDVAAQHLAKIALENREALLREFITHTPAAIAMLDRDMRYIKASRRWLADYKLEGQNIDRRSHYEVFPDIPERWKQVHQRVLAGAVESCEEDPFPRAGGGVEWLQWEARPWHDATGQVGGLIFFTQVITERKELGLRLEEQNRQLLRSNAELEQFAYVASHDLQEPLRAIAGCTQILAQRYRCNLDPQADELIEHIVLGAARMKALIEGLLSLSRVSSQQHVASWVDTTHSVELALDNLNASIVEQGANVVCASLPRIRGDATQVLQLFQNLIGNALKYRGRARAEVSITAVQGSGSVQFSIRDNGIGIRTEYFERIFGVFQRLHTRDEYPGTGIGLAICRKIVERHGGRIWLESEVDVGSTFFFTLPS